MAHKTAPEAELSPSQEAAGHAIAGGIAGMAAIAAFYPLSTLSTRYIYAGCGWCVCLLKL